MKHTMGILQVALFGDMRVTQDNWLTEVSLTREIQALLAFLLLQRHKVHFRDVLADIFWGEQSQERARGSLNTAVWKLKKALEPKGVFPGTYLKTSHQSGVTFNRESQYWLDIEVFENETNGILVRPFQTAEDSHIRSLEKTLELYRGELLEGLYEEWALRERERFRALYLKSLIYLLQYYGFHDAYEIAISYGQQILDLDPLREEIHREIMRLYLGNGQRALAIRQYEICRVTLDKEFGIAPMEDTQALYAQIFMRKSGSVSAPVMEEKISLDQAFRQLREATQNIELARAQVQQAFQLIAKISEHLEEKL